VKSTNAFRGKGEAENCKNVNCKAVGQRKRTREKTRRQSKKGAVERGPASFAATPKKKKSPRHQEHSTQGASHTTRQH